MNYITSKLKCKKKKLFITVSIVAFILILTLIFINIFNYPMNKVTIIKNGTGNANNNFIVSPERKKELLNLNDPTIKKLVDLSKSYPKLNKLLDNIDRYPKSLLTLAIKNNEALDFVIDYPDRDDIDLNKLIIPNEIKERKIPLFIQWDERWGYHKYGDDFIALSGCAPTSLAMVIAGLTNNKNITPKDVADFSYENGYFVKGSGTSRTLISEGSSHFGLNSKELPLSKPLIISTLKAGHPIIVSVGPGTFTGKGHFLVLTDITDDGKIIINDPNSVVNSSKTWDINIFLKETLNLWKITAN